MEAKFPFTSYDFWAYLASGFMFLFFVDQFANTQQFARDSWTVVQGFIAVSAAYAVGHLIASFSAWLLERVVVGRLLGYPRNVLFGRANAWNWVRLIMPGYFKRLPDETVNKALDRGSRDGATGPGEALFWAAYGRARQDQVVMGRLDNFLNMYGFCRNASVVFLIGGVLLGISHFAYAGPVVHLYGAIGALILGCGLTLRYLKFYRHYAVEVFTSYAHYKD